MKKIDLEEIVIYDFKKILIIVPREVIDSKPVELKERFLPPHNEAWRCGGFRSFVTRAGREAIRVLPGRGFWFCEYYGMGDRSWQGWGARRPAKNSSEVFATAAANSRGGGVWTEVWIFRDGVSFTSAEVSKVIEEIADLA